MDTEKKFNLSLKNKKNRRYSRGQSLVELGLSFTFIMFLTAGAVDLGRVYFSYIALRDAAQEGAVYASLFPTDEANTRLRVRSSSTAPLNLNNTTDVSITYKIIGSAACANGFNRVEVTVIYNFNFFMPFIGTLILSPNDIVPIYARMTHTILRPPC